MATSGGYGFRFDPGGRFNHLLDPRSGAAAALHRSATVVLPTATAADALSTACDLMPIEAMARDLRRVGGEAHVVTADGDRRVVKV